MTLVDRLDETARQCPTKIAVRFEGRSFTYQEMKDRIDRLASALLEQDVRYQDNVALISPNCPACIEIVLACARIGAVCAQYNTRLSPSVIAQLLEKAGARVVFLSGDMYRLIKDYLKQIGHPLKLVLLDQAEQASQGLDYADLIAQTAPLKTKLEVLPSDAAIMMYTSGTTGLPRGVMLSHEALLTRVDIDIKEMAFRPTSVVLCALPLFHVTCVSSYISLCIGAELVIAGSRKAEDIIALINKFSVTHMGLVPFMMRDITSYLERKTISINSLELVIYGGEPIDESLLMLCHRYFSCDLLQGYGMTEADSAITMLLPEHHKIPRLLSTVGKVVPGMELRIVDAEGANCAAGVVGEIVVKTPTLTMGYWADASYSAEVIRDGWYWTGDIGMLDEDGFLTLIDRKNNLVITGGENVYPLEVSRCIRSIGPDIVDAVVVGVPDAHWGESLAAFVVVKEGSTLSPGDIAEFCARHLGSYKKPRKVLFVGGLERSASGKISKEHLRKLVAQLA